MFDTTTTISSINFGHSFVLTEGTDVFKKIRDTYLNGLHYNCVNITTSRLEFVDEAKSCYPIT